MTLFGCRSRGEVGQLCNNGPVLNSFSQTSQQTNDTFMDSIARNIPLSELQSYSSDGSKRNKKKKKDKKKNHSRDHMAGSPVSTPKVSAGKDQWNSSISTCYRLHLSCRVLRAPQTSLVSQFQCSITEGNIFISIFNVMNSTCNFILCQNPPISSTTQYPFCSLAGWLVPGSGSPSNVLSSPTSPSVASHSHPARADYVPIAAADI